MRRPLRPLGAAARGNFRATWAKMTHVGPNFRQEGPTWVQLGPLWDPTWSQLGANLGSCWAHVGRICRVRRDAAFFLPSGPRSGLVALVFSLADSSCSQGRKCKKNNVKKTFVCNIFGASWSRQGFFNYASNKARGPWHHKDSDAAKLII